MDDLVKQEEKVLKFWQEKNIFQKSLAQNQKSPKFVFYEGPPTANGKPGIHHIVARALKDIICRYKTMKNFYVLRKAGWDTHGLPVEIQVEKELNLKNKKEVESYGILEFNQKCKESVWRYKNDWEKMTEKIGYWLDMEKPYVTYENEYIESLWWILKKIWEKGLLFKDYKIVPFCPRCGTTLSSHELAQGYKRVKEPSVYLKFELVDSENTYLLVWTTTPWTLPGNEAVAINPEFTYVKVQADNKIYILAKERINDCFQDKEYEVLEEMKGESLVGLKYRPLYQIKEAAEWPKKIYQVLAGNFVTLEDGTGLVHIAPAFGEDDYQLIKEQNQGFPVLITVDSEGKMLTPNYPWDGMFVKEADKLIIKDLVERNILFKEQLYEHDYPFCWRCDTPLIYYAKSSWFIKMTALKDKILENNQKINWMPAHLKEGRFGEWLREVKDWNLSRERYWGTPLPVWQCGNEQCGHLHIIGSFKELEELSGQKIKDPHRPYIDEITFKCPKCGGTMKRVPEVIDCWFDSGAMPLAQWHYPFENKDFIDKKEFFPADFIAEGIDQTRGWFYTLLAISTLLDMGISYKNVVVNGVVLDEKGQKMSKSKGNIVVPQEVIEKYGADCVRLYFYILNQVDQPKRFSFKDVDDLFRKFFSTLENCLAFYKMYAPLPENTKEKKILETDIKKPENLLDKWIISRLNTLTENLTDNLEKYDIVAAARFLLPFVDDLSNWYIRRSRKRFQRPESPEEKKTASVVLRHVLLEFSKLVAPFTPFISEYIYQSLKGEKDAESVHLCLYPKSGLRDEALEEKMKKVREIIVLALAQRAEKGIKVRQPLASLKIKIQKSPKQSELATGQAKIKIDEELYNLVKEEVNVKEILFDDDLKEEVWLDTEITEELKNEGEIRDIVRQIQRIKKELNVEPKNKVSLYFVDEEEREFSKNIRETITKETLVEIADDEKNVSSPVEKIIKIKGKDTAVLVGIE
jgi:isoleucyl-tRNA synthetase